MKRLLFNYVVPTIVAAFLLPCSVYIFFYLIDPDWTSDTLAGIKQPTLCQNGNDIVLDGDLSHKLQEQWAQLLISLADKKQLRLFLNSRGGSNDVAESISNDVKRLGITTVLPDNSMCYSACPLIFIGSEIRIADPTAELGFHSPSVSIFFHRVDAGYEDRVEVAMKRFPESSKWLADIEAFKSDEMKRRTAKMMQSYDFDFAIIQKVGPMPACNG